MAKQKKRASQLTSLQKAFAKAAYFPSIHPETFKSYWDELKERAKQQQKTYGYGGNPIKIVDRSPDTAANWAEIKSEKNFSLCMALARDQVLNAWYREKRVFTMSEETVDYILNEFPFVYIQQSTNLLIDAMCERPIYIEFPDAIATQTNCTEDDIKSEYVNIQGIFVGQCCLVSDGLDGQLGVKTVGIQVNDTGTFMALHAAADISVSEYIRTEEQDGFQRLLISAVLYLSYVYNKRDGIGSVLIPKSRKGIDECFEVLPIPFTDSIPNKKDPNSLVVAGLCSLFGFLSRENLVKDLLKVSAEMKEYDSFWFDQNCTKQCDELSTAFLRKTATNMVLAWEYHRVIYQFDSKLRNTMRDRYLLDILTQGIDPSLLRYMPQETMVLHETGPDNMVLLSIAEYKRDGGERELGIAVSLLVEKFTSTLVPLDITVGSIQGTPDVVDLTFDVLCILVHILRTYRQRAMKRVTEDAISAGNPASTELVPVPPKPQIRHVLSDGNEGSLEEQTYRIGQTIAEGPFELYTVTDKTVKRARNEEKLIRMGWKMSPHTRRPHPHRYWVGHGAAKHLEIRWLDRIHIHKDTPAEITTLHQVKAKN